MSKRRLALGATLVAALLMSACGSDSPSESADTTAAPSDATDAGDPTGSEPTGGGSAPAIDPARCEANRAAGTITYLSGFDFAAGASIVELIVAKEAGYFDELCLDVELKASFSTANYPLIASGDAQFASAGSFTELLDFGMANSTEYVALAVEGKTGIDALIVKEGAATELTQLRGETIGVKGKITPSVKVMLAEAGLVEGTDYQTVPIDGFDPKVHIEIPTIVGFPGYKSNEPGQLEAAGIPFELFDPADADIPGSFGVLYTSRQFLDAHRGAATDFLRAAMKGLADAIADPAAAVDLAVEYINGNGNPSFLSPEGELFRWTTESGLLQSTTPAGQPIGYPDPAFLQAQVDAYARAGIFADALPPIDGAYDTQAFDEITDDTGALVWPG